MATLGNANNASQQNTSRRSYISTAPFFNNIFTYTTTLLPSLRTQGTLTPIAGGNCVTCPAGRVLRENGRKLFPDANPDVTQYLVGVYDSQNYQSGFINPNDSVFAIYNTDRPNFIPDNNDGLEGPPILTTGNIVSTEGFVGVLSSLTSTITYAGSYLNVSTPIVQAGVNLDIDCAGPAATPQTTATLYPNGDIISYNSTTLSTVRLYANGNIFNSANVSTLGNTYVRGNELIAGSAYIAGTLSTIGITSLSGGVRVGNGDLINRITTGTVSGVTVAPFGGASAGAQVSVTITVPDADTNDIVILNPEGITPKLIITGYYVSGANTVTVLFYVIQNMSSETLATCRYTLIKNA
jgi:hypothetical protein